MRASSPNVGSPVPAVASPAASPPIARLPARARWLTALAGVLGTAALGAYYSTVLVPLPADNATAAQVVALGLHYRVPILIDVVLQIGGSALSVIFALALIHLAGTAHHLAGRLAVMTGAVVLGLSLAEGTFALGVVQAATNRHPQAALACFDLTNVFVHVFLLAPSLFLLLGLALWNTTLLPRLCAPLALVLGLAFQTLGLVGLFNTAAVSLVIVVLVLQEVWTVAAALTLALRAGRRPSA
ncbi:MAG TPA: hypothetical protein VFE42_26010 [Chloroflexota bacterium]|nr:hypothetical protein [Chloroflexota bacterium]